MNDHRSNGDFTPRQPAPEAADHLRPSGAGTPLEGALADALSQRADRVQAEADSEARKAIDRRIHQRSHTRQTRRGLIAATVLVAVATGGFLVDGRSDGGGDGAPEVATQGAETNTTGLVLRPGQRSDDPGLLGLPRLMIGSASGLELVLGPDPVGTTATGHAAPASFAPPLYASLQVLRPDGASLPVVFAPWDPAHAQASLPTPGEGNEAVEVDGIAAALSGEGEGWRELSWPLRDGTKVRLLSYGLDRDALLEIATGLRHAPGASGYRFEELPGGWQAKQLGAPRPDDLVPYYSISYAGADGLRVLLNVGRGSEELAEESLARVLSESSMAEPVTVKGDPGVLVAIPDGTWTVLWSPAEQAGAQLVLTGATRVDVDRVISQLERASATEWGEVLRAARGHE